MPALLASQQRPWKEFTILLFVEPCAFNVEQPQASQAGQCESVQRELCDGLIGAGVRLVVENVHGTIADLEEIDVARENSSVARLLSEAYAVFYFERLNICLLQPDRNFDRD